MHPNTNATGARLGGNAAQMLDFGPRIRDIRKKRKMKLKDLAAATGMSASFLSEVERGLSQPSMGSLRKICQALGVSLLNLENHAGDQLPKGGAVGEAPSRLPNGFKEITEVTVVQADRRKKIAYPNQRGFYELVTPDLNRNLEVLSLTLAPGFDSGPHPIIDPPGEKCLLILRGCMDFHVKGETHRLKQGDSVSYPADSPLYYQVVGEEAVECLIIITPPGF